MYNILLDRLPDNYNGFLIRTDFRIGLQIYACFYDKSLKQEERFMISLKLLYGNGIPKNMDMAIEGLMWFLNLGEKPDNKAKQSNQKPIMDFEIDSSRIYSGFKSKFGIDLNKVRMHWFEFRYLLLELKDCHMSDVIEIRQKKIDKNMPLEQRIEYRRLKKIYAITDSSMEDEETQRQLINYLHNK
jgi:hypothetical protein